MVCLHSLKDTRLQFKRTMDTKHFPQSLLFDNTVQCTVSNENFIVLILSLDLPVGFDKKNNAKIKKDNLQEE